MKAIDNIESLLGDEQKGLIHSKAKLKGVELAIEIEHSSNNYIDPEDVIAWLVTQPNANGTLYLENVVRQYMGALRTAPTKLRTSAVFDARSVFACHTADELKTYWDILRTAPNYAQVNSSTSGMFSAGMGCYMRYLQHLSDERNVEKLDVVQLIERHNLEYVDKRDSGGALWVIGGRELLPIMLKLRDSGFHFSFQAGGGRSSDYRQAWWYKSSKTASGQKAENSEKAQPVCKDREGITNSVPSFDFPRPELKVEKLGVLPLIERHNLKYVDKRDCGGALWVIGGRELLPIMMKLRDAGFPFTFKVGGGRSSDYRDAWWYKSSETASEQKTGLPEETKPVYSERSGITNTEQRVDFTHPELYVLTCPLTCTIKGQAIFPSKQNWHELLVAITEWFLAEGNPNLASIGCKPLCGSNRFFLPTKTDIGSCSLLSNGKWIYINNNSPAVVTTIRNLCLHCGVSLDDVIITYERKYGKPMTQSVQTEECHAKVAPTAFPNPVLAPQVIEKLILVLSAHFVNGYRLNSPIELARFRSFAEEDFGEELALSDEELKRYISTCGTTYDGKVYPVSAETKERIKELAEEYFSGGAQAIFFAEFYTKNEKWLFEASVVCEQMLIDILRGLFPKLSFTQTYFGYTDASLSAVLEGEILRAWGDDVLLTYGQLAERLRYIPLERIKSLLGQKSDFIWNSVETFSHVSRVEITEEERQAIREAAVRECTSSGYASIADLPLGEIKEHNCELSITALQNAVFRICLSDKFDLKGKIVTHKGEAFDAYAIMKNYCRTIDKCSLDDLLNYEKKLTGQVNRWIPMEAGNTVLVRIDKSTYVADRHVHFNADIVDEAIGLFVKRDYLPLKAFTTFGAFPDCGQTWNLFLLESYCRRFSQKFRFDTLSINSRNAGAVIRKSCGMDYTEIMTDAVLNADVPLKDAAVGKFLYESGYTGKSTTQKVNEIIEKAKAIRESRG